MDLVDCDDISEQAILHELKQRFVKNEIYSSIGPILIAVNPFQLIHALYSASVRESFVHSAISAYSSEATNEDVSSKPHVWMVAKAAYRQLLQDRCPQAIVISGESGGE
ncbi:hypothetical protein EON64_00635 [archaeon]|nr:MAG: hypothetical protein EON64_00635 [archaeon]